MNKKIVLKIILVLTIISIGIIIIFNIKKRYNKYVISDTKWDNIINNKIESTNIKIDNIKFNDYSLLVDEKNNTIYYSIININGKYNPKINYKMDDNLKLVFKGSLKEDNAKVMIYNDTNYRIYDLVVTDLPIININYKEEDLNKRIPIEIYIFDNHIDAYARVIKSDGMLIIIEEGKEYRFSLKQESLGHNNRDNKISILGLPKHHEYLLNQNSNGKYVNLFMNNEYQGTYSLDYVEERKVMPNGSIEK